MDFFSINDIKRFMISSGGNRIVNNINLQDAKMKSI